MTQQMRDTLAISQSRQGTVYDIYVPQGAKLSGPLQDAYDDGLINIFHFWEQ